MDQTPQTSPPSDADVEEYRRYGQTPLATRRMLWVQREAAAIHRQRTGRGDPFPTLEDYAAAAHVIPEDVTK